jgi:hypothetical protein
MRAACSSPRAAACSSASGHEGTSPVTGDETLLKMIIHIILVIVSTNTFIIIEEEVK